MRFLFIVVQFLDEDDFVNTSYNQNGLKLDKSWMKWVVFELTLVTHTHTHTHTHTQTNTSNYLLSQCQSNEVPNEIRSVMLSYSNA